MSYKLTASDRRQKNGRLMIKVYNRAKVGDGDLQSPIRHIPPEATLTCDIRLMAPWDCKSPLPPVPTLPLLYTYILKWRLRHALKGTEDHRSPSPPVVYA